MSPEQTISQSAQNTGAALRRAFAARPIDESALRAAVLAYVDEMKRLGAPVERTIVEIKRIAESKNAPGATLDRRNSPPPTSKVTVNDAVTWCIEHYFGPTEPRSTS